MTICLTSGPQIPETGHHTDCGTVTGLDKTAVGDLGTVYHTAETNACARDGSSGAPVYKNHTGYGLISTGAGCDQFYQGLIAAEDGSNVGLI